MTSVVYTLSDPRTDEPRYVGQTAEPLAVRLKKHCWPSTIKNEVCHRTKWINKLLKAGVQPKIEVLETVSPESVNEAEIFWIEQFRALGFRLVNESAGGDGWTKGKKRGAPTAKARQNMSLAAMGKKKAPRKLEHTLNNSLAQSSRVTVRDNNGNLYYSIKEAARMTGVGETAIRRIIYDQQLQTRSGMKFTYEER